MAHQWAIRYRNCQKKLQRPGTSLTTNVQRGHFFHSIKWKKILENVLHIDPKYWIISSGQKIVGIVPSKKCTLTYLKGLDTLPHSEFNSILLDNNFDPRDLHEVLTQFASKYSFFFLNTNRQEFLDYIGYDHYPYEIVGNMVLNLQQKPPETIWENFSAKKGQRKFIRRFDEKGFKIHETHEPEDMKIFHRYYAENLIRINADVLPLTFFQKLPEVFSSDEMRVTLLSKGDTYAGGLLTFMHPASKTAYFQYLSLNRNLPNTYHPTYYLFWEGLNWAWDNGYEKISFGRQKLDPKNPRFQIKADFGAEYKPIYSQIVLFTKTTSLLYRIRKLRVRRNSMPLDTGTPVRQLEASVLDKRCIEHPRHIGRRPGP